MSEELQYAVGPYIMPVDAKWKPNLYGLHRCKAEEWAKSVGREIAEGPTQYVPFNYYGPVELWPLVTR